MLTETANAPTLAAAAATFLVVTAQSIHTWLRVRSERREKSFGSITLRNIEANVGNLTTQVEAFTREQRITNESLRVHITEVDHIVRGVDGENGQRSKITRLERRVDALERAPQTGAQVGSYAPPGAASR
jgi:hypothetical protein